MGNRYIPTERHKLMPKKENENKGFHYTMTDEQLQAGSKRTIEEIFEWLESTNRFIYSIQTPEERERVKRAKNIEN